MTRGYAMDDNHARAFVQVKGIVSLSFAVHDSTVTIVRVVDRGAGHSVSGLACVLIRYLFNFSRIVV